jgi:hypothetical protein
MDPNKQLNVVRPRLPGITPEQSFPGSRPEAEMITASQLRGATPVGSYSWRVGPSLTAEVCIS